MSIRRAHREKMKKYPVSTVYLQVIGTGAPGAPRALYVFTEQCRYLFNCGEGCQRLAYEHKVKLSMMEHIMITYKSWENVGGLPGTFLTLQDSGVPEIFIHGPPGIDPLYYDTRNFMRLSELKLSSCHYKNNNGCYDNGPLIIKYAAIWPENNSVFTEDNCSDNFDTIRQKSEESILCKDLAIAYICRPTPKPGALLPNKCQELGVPMGPLMGDLKRGKDVILPCGKVVTAEEVTESHDPDPVFIVIEIPTLAHLPSLLNSKELSGHQIGCDANDLAQVIVHFSSPQVIVDSRYKEWAAKFGPSCSHIYLNENNTCMGSERVHKIQYKLNNLYPDSFPLLHDTGIPFVGKRLRGVHDCDNKTMENARRDSMKTGEKLDNNSHQLESSCKESGMIYEKVSTLLMYRIRPHTKFDKSSRLSLDPDAYIDESYEKGSYESVKTDVVEEIHCIEQQIPDTLKEREFPSILFLGTGSCIPNKTRNTSGIAFDISETSTMILDCGEGTFGQLVRCLGIDATFMFLMKLKGIYISHLHADHHIGLIRLMLSRQRAFQKLNLEVPKLFLLAPSIILVYLLSYDSNFESIKDLFTLIPNHSLNFTNGHHSDCEKSGNADVFKHLEVKRMETCLVPHCPDAYAVSIVLRDGWHLVYSGDTMPCQDLVIIGKKCDLLIHEATMEDELIEDAKYKRHSTTSGALEIASLMMAKHVILTHFSQRYAKVPLLKTVPENASVAFDNMRVRIRNLPCLPRLYRAFIAMFCDDYEFMIEKTKKRKAKEALSRA